MYRTIIIQDEMVAGSRGEGKERVEAKGLRRVSTLGMYLYKHHFFFTVPKSAG